MTRIAELSRPRRLCQRQVQVVGHLGHRVHRQLPALRVPLRDAGIQLDLPVRDLGTVVAALHHQVGGGEAGVDVAELLLDQALEVAGLVVVQPHGVVGTRRIGLEIGRQAFDLDLHRTQRGLGGVNVVGGHREQRLAAVAHAVARQRPFVLRDRDHAVGGAEVLAGDHRAHAGHRPSARGVDVHDAPVGDLAAADAPDQGVGEGQVGGVARATADLLDTVDQGPTLADRVCRGGRLLRQRQMLGLHGCVSWRCPRVAATACTDSMIFT